MALYGSESHAGGFDPLVRHGHPKTKIKRVFAGQQGYPGHDSGRAGSAGKPAKILLPNCDLNLPVFLDFSTRLGPVRHGSKGSEYRRKWPSALDLESRCDARVDRSSRQAPRSDAMYLVNRSLDSYGGPYGLDRRVSVAMGRTRANLPGNPGPNRRARQ